MDKRKQFWDLGSYIILLMWLLSCDLIEFRIKIRISANHLSLIFRRKHDPCAQFKIISIIL